MKRMKWLAISLLAIVRSCVNNNNNNNNFIYVDLPFQVGEASVSMYAYDNQVYVAGHTSEGVVKNLVRDGTRIIYCKRTVTNINVCC